MNSKKLCLLIAIFSVSCQKINSAKKNLVAKQNVEACFGTQDITLNSTFKTPEKILILWNGYIVVDECKSLIQNLLVYEKTENVIHLQADGYGYTDRPFYSL